MRRAGDQRGSTTVELAFVFPVLLTVLCGSMALLWLVGARSALADAARSAARFAAIETEACLEPCYPDEAAVQAEVDDDAETFGLTGCEVALTAVTARNEDPDLSVTCELPNVFAPLQLLGIDSITAATTVHRRAE